MAQTITITLHEKDTGTQVGNAITDLVRARFLEEYNEVGEGSFTIPTDHAEASSVAFADVARVLHDGVERYAFEIRNIDVEREQESEDAGKLMTVGGPGVGVLLGTSNIGGGVVYPGCGDPAAFQSDTRMFGWMDCCCFDHAAHGFSSPPGMVHLQRDPDPPWEPDSPEDWPDGAARRIYCDPPVQTIGGVNEVQSITLGTSIDSGTFQLVFEGETTADISSPWAAADVESALEALSNIDGVTVTGSGIDSDPYVVTFDTGNVSQRDVELLTVIHDSLNHPPQTAEVTETTKGNKGEYASADNSCCYFYDTFTTTQDRSLTAFINLSPFGEVFIDGVSIYEQSTRSSAKNTRAVPIDLPAGDHCVTARVCKPNAGTAVSWFMYSLAEAAENEDGGYDLGQVIHRSDASWQVLSTSSSATPPGANVGEIMVCLHDEAIAIGDLAGITLNFTGSVDSNGVAWTDEFVWGIQIGTGLLDVLQQLADLAGISWRMNEDLSLDIWQDRGTDRTATVTFDEPASDTDRTGGILISSYTGEGPRATTLLVETQEGVAEAADATGVTNFGQRRLGLTLGTAPTYEGLADFAVNTFSTFARAVWALSLLTWGDTSLNHLPYADFDLDDLLTAPNHLGNASTWRLVQIQMQMEQDGKPLWGLSLMDE